MQIGIYARVSTQKEAEKGISIKDQVFQGDFSPVPLPFYPLP
jgi:hypothetical protein